VLSVFTVNSPDGVACRPYRIDILRFEACCRLMCVNATPGASEAQSTHVCEIRAEPLRKLIATPGRNRPTGVPRNLPQAHTPPISFCDSSNNTSGHGCQDSAVAQTHYSAPAFRNAWLAPGADHPLTRRASSISPGTRPRGFDRARTVSVTD
jgi:hypothetical protein